MSQDRAIRFRAFDETSKQMVLDVRYWGHSLDVSGAIPSHIHLMQFTGLHDKNGEMIFEGDVIKSRENDEVWRVDEMLPAHRHSHVTNIGYFSGKRYHPRNSPAARYDNLDDWMSWPEMYEVIGNIYENPELLK